MHYIERGESYSTNMRLLIIMPIVKYNNVMGSRIIELFGLGYNKTEVAKLIPCSRSTLDIWINKYDLSTSIEKAEHDFMRNAITRGLVALAEGATSTECVKEYTEEDEDGKIVRTIEKRRVMPPSEKAIQILSKKYAKVFADTTQHEDNVKHLTLNINPNAMSLREIQQLNASSNPLGAQRLEQSVEAECVEILDPPTSEEKSE